MKGRWPDRNFSRRRKGIDERYVRWAMVVGFVLIAVVAIAVFGGGDDDEDELQESLPIEAAVAEGASHIEAAIATVHEQLERGEFEAVIDARRLQDARRAEWTDGQSVLLAGELKPDQSAYLALLGRNVPDPEIFRVLTATEEEFDFRRSRPGDRWRAQVDEQGRVVEFRYETSPEDVWVTRLDEEGEYVAEKKAIDVDVRTKAVAGSVEGSFWLSMAGAGHSDVLALRFMKVFEYTIDFNTETRDGDHFAMVFEEIYLDDQFLRYGRVLAATYIGQYGTRQAYYHESDDESGYFDEDGESMQRQFLRSPLEVTRVTSTFGRRQHPITGDERMHRGVDYGAPTGTRVRAVADGRVHFAGWRGGYGNLLILRHSGGFETRYAHLSRFESGISSGTRVSQGQIVARSGNTGASTAPHLHYEMLRNGRHIDPLTVEATSGDPLTGQELSEFRSQRIEPLSQRLVNAFRDQAPAAVALWQEQHATATSDD